jgi:predicted PurR-regulated permease PerM
MDVPEDSSDRPTLRWVPKVGIGAWSFVGFVVATTIVVCALAAVSEMAPLASGGLVTEILSGVSTLIGLASGLILGALIMYYLLKDGSQLRRSVKSPAPTPPSGTRPTTSSATPAGPSATTDAVVPCCPP